MNGMEVDLDHEATVELEGDSCLPQVNPTLTYATREVLHVLHVVDTDRRRCCRGGELGSGLPLYRAVQN